MPNMLDLTNKNIHKWDIVLDIVDIMKHAWGSKMVDLSIQNSDVTNEYDGSMDEIGYNGRLWQIGRQ